MSSTYVIILDKVTALFDGDKWGDDYVWAVHTDSAVLKTSDGVTYLMSKDPTTPSGLVVVRDMYNTKTYMYEIVSHLDHSIEG